MRFPHSDTPGSQVATHLPEAFRCYATSFIAFSSLGIHHSPLMPTIPMLTCSLVVLFCTGRTRPDGTQQDNQLAFISR